MYLSPAELSQRIDQSEMDQLLVDLDEAAADAKVDGALQDAESMINSYISRRYTVPVANVTNQLKRLVTDIARYYLWDDAPSENVEQRYTNAIALIKDIAQGKADLAGTTESPVADSDTTGSLIHISTPVAQLDLDKY